MQDRTEKLKRAARKLQQDSALSELQRLAPILDEQAPSRRLARGARESFTALLGTQEDPEPSLPTAVDRLVAASAGLTRALAEVSALLDDDHSAKQLAPELSDALHALLATVWVKRPSLEMAVRQCVSSRGSGGSYPRREALVDLEAAILWHEVHGDIAD